MKEKIIIMAVGISITVIGAMINLYATVNIHTVQITTVEKGISEIQGDIKELLRRVQ